MFRHAGGKIGFMTTSEKKCPPGYQRTLTELRLVPLKSNLSRKQHNLFHNVAHSITSLDLNSIIRTFLKHSVTMHPIARTVRAVRPGFFRRPFSTARATQSAWTPQPGPPRLPKEEQEIFEKLQEKSTGAFSTPRSSTSPTDPAPPTHNPVADSEGNVTEPSRSDSAGDMLAQLKERARVAANGDGAELHPNVRRGAKPEFEGEVNPSTGEVGGPKNDPLRWKGDWSYNGRVTDF
jgi:hypothetical protein